MDRNPCNWVDDEEKVCPDWVKPLKNYGVMIAISPLIIASIISLNCFAFSYAVKTLIEGE